MSFWDAYDFWRDPMAAVLIAATLCSYLGVYVVVRRLVFVGAALTQISGVGIALSFYLASGLAAGHDHAEHPFWLEPEVAALVAAVVGAVLLSFVRGAGRLTVETVVGAVWILASAALLIVLSSPRVREEAHAVDEVLYGTAILPTPGQLRVLFWIAVGLLALHLALRKHLLFVTQDAEMARTLGYRTALWDGLLHASLGVGVSFAVRSVGALPTFAFLVVPAAAAILVVRRITWAFPLAVGFGTLSGAAGYYLAFTQKLPTGATIVATSGLLLVPAAIVRALRRSP